MATDLRVCAGSTRDGYPPRCRADAEAMNSVLAHNDTAPVRLVYGKRVH